MRPIHQYAAVCFAVTLAWDYCRAPEVLSYFSSWSLFLQFIYFQLPTRSRALCFAHSLAFICAITIPLLYLYDLLWNPHIELAHADKWDVSYSTVIVRTFLVHFAPVLCHAVDVTAHQASLVAAYQTKSRRGMVLWSLASYASLNLLHEVVAGRVGDDGESYSCARSERGGCGWRARAVMALAAFGFGFFLLTMLILRPAYLPSHTSTGQDPGSPRLVN